MEMAGNGVVAEAGIECGIDGKQGWVFPLAFIVDIAERQSQAFLPGGMDQRCFEVIVPTFGREFVVEKEVSADFFVRVGFGGDVPAIFRIGFGTFGIVPAVWDFAFMDMAEVLGERKPVQGAGGLELQDYGAACILVLAKVADLDFVRRADIQIPKPGRTLTAVQLLPKGVCQRIVFFPVCFCNILAFFYSLESYFWRCI